MSARAGGTSTRSAFAHRRLLMREDVAPDTPLPQYKLSMGSRATLEPREGSSRR